MNRLALFVLLIGSSAFAQTYPFAGPGRQANVSGYPVDEYVDFGSGTGGSAITAAGLNAHGSLCTWSLGGSGTQQTFSTTSATAAPGAITVGGVTYPGNTSTLNYQYDPGGTTTIQYAQCALSSSLANVSSGFDYATTSTTASPLSIFSGFQSSGGDYVLSHWYGASATPQIIISDTYSPRAITLTTSHTYWVTQLYCSTCSYGGGGNHWMMAFDPSANWTLAGWTTVPVGFSGSTGPATNFTIGRDGSDASDGVGQWSFGNEILSASAIFPLVPHAITANTPAYNNAGGTYTNSVTVAVSDALPPAIVTVNYCEDTTGTCTPSTSYSAPLTITTTGTHLRTQAVSSGWTSSAIYDQTYTITSSPVTAEYAGIVTDSSSGAATVTLTGSPTAGHTLALIAYNSAYTGATDTVNGAWTSVSAMTGSGKYYYSQYSTGSGSIYTLCSTGAGVTTISLTGGTAYSPVDVVVLDISGLSSTGCVEGSTVGVGHASGTLTTGSIAVSGSSTVLGIFTALNPASLSVSSPYTLAGSVVNSGNVDLLVSYQTGVTSNTTASATSAVAGGAAALILH